jgi:hypothetical protein
MDQQRQADFCPALERGLVTTDSTGRPEGLGSHSIVLLIRFYNQAGASGILAPANTEEFRQRARQQTILQTERKRHRQKVAG